jgi:PAS domain S-box-containing protein
MNKQSDALLKQIAELSLEIQKKSHLKADTLTGVFTEFRRTLKNFDDAEKELRHQNAELARARERLEIERQRYQEMFEFAPDAYLVTNADGVIQEANQPAAELFNRSARRLEGCRLVDFVDDRDRKLYHTLIEKVRRIHDMELRLIPDGLPPVEVAMTLATVYDPHEQPMLLRWILRDITERKQAQAALDASERRFRAIFKEADMGILLVKPDGRIVDANRAFQEMLGYTSAELRGKGVDELCYSSSESQFMPRLAEMRARDLAHSRYEKRYRCKEGSMVWARISLSLLLDGSGQVEYIIALAQNITAERAAAIEVAELRRRMLESGEVERLHLAQELHDGPLQDLYGAVFKLNDLYAQVNDEAMIETLRGSQDIIKAVASTLRLICGELRPPTLANLGLEPAIRSHTDKILEIHSDLHIELHLTRDRQELPEQVRLALFRIYQQCMANILRHSQASRVVVAFHFDEREIVLDVWDNGQGFTVPENWMELLREGHYGLAGIAERVHALGGTLRIESRPGGGALVHVVTPRSPNGAVEEQHPVARTA